MFDYRLLYYSQLSLISLGFNDLLIKLGRGDRMKQAKADAQELIDLYRAEKQKEFDNSTESGGASTFSSSLQGETEKEVAMMQAQFQGNQAQAIEILLSKCCEVDVSIPVARVRATQKEHGM